MSCPSDRTQGLNSFLKGTVNQSFTAFQQNASLGHALNAMLRFIGDKGLLIPGGFMKRIMIYAATAATLAVGQSNVAHAADANATGEAVIVTPLSLVNTRDLEFGALLPSATAGTVVINPTNDARTVTGGVTAAGSGGQAAQFWTYGGPLQFIFVTRGPLPVLNRVGGGGSMNVSGLTLNGPVFRFLNSAGLLDLRVGGTLQVGANQAPGVYEGDFDITVTYF